MIEQKILIKKMIKWFKKPYKALSIVYYTIVRRKGVVFKTEKVSDSQLTRNSIALIAGILLKIKFTMECV